MYRKEARSWVKHLDFTFFDLLCMELSMIIAYAWRFNGKWLFLNDFYTGLAALLLLVDIVVVFFAEPYNGILRRNKYQELRATVSHCIVVFAGLLLYLYATKQSAASSRQMLGFMGVSMVISCYAVRVLWKRLIRYRKLADKNKSEMLVVAESYNVEQCLHEIATDKYSDYRVIGVVVVDQDMVGKSYGKVPVVATADSFMEYVRTQVIDEIFIDGNTRSSAEALAAELVELGLTVHIGLFHSDTPLMSRQIDTIENYTVLTTSMHIATNRQMFIKRAMDIVGGIIGLVITFIAFIIFAPIIKIQSPGPVFYKSLRIGRNGRRFVFYKFRTMYDGADKDQEALMEQNEMQGNMFKIENDPRIIPIGHFMRKHSIDELPQFWNVLKGDMSLVGTRPPTEDEFEKYEYHHKARLGMRPGLTGMWQVSGRSNITDFEEVVAIDTKYIADWTLGLDIQIIFATIWVVLTGKGSK